MDQDKTIEGYEKKTLDIPGVGKMPCILLPLKDALDTQDKNGALAFHLGKIFKEYVSQPYVDTKQYLEWSIRANGNQLAIPQAQWSMLEKQGKKRFVEALVNAPEAIKKLNKIAEAEDRYWELPLATQANAGDISYPLRTALNNTVKQLDIAEEGLRKKEVTTQRGRTITCVIIPLGENIKQQRRWKLLDRVAAAIHDVAAYPYAEIFKELEWLTPTTRDELAIPLDQWETFGKEGQLHVLQEIRNDVNRVAQDKAQVKTCLDFIDELKLSISAKSPFKGTLRYGGNLNDFAFNYAIPIPTDDQRTMAWRRIGELSNYLNSLTEKPNAFRISRSTQGEGEAKERHVTISINQKMLYQLITGPNRGKLAQALMYPFDLDKTEDKKCTITSMVGNIRARRQNADPVEQAPAGNAPKPWQGCGNQPVPRTAMISYQGALMDQGPQAEIS